MLHLLHSYPDKNTGQYPLRPALHLHITVCAGAVLLALQTAYRLQLSSIGWMFYAFLTVATFFSYNLHFLLAGRVQQSSQQLLWFAQNQKSIAGGLTVALLLLVTTWLPYAAHTWLLAILIVLNGIYTLPLVVPVHKPMLPIVTCLKPYYIGACWTCVTVVLPVYISGTAPDGRVVPEACCTFMLVTLATMLFDWRDRHADLQSGIRTSANLLSKNGFQNFFLLHLILFSVCGLLVALPYGLPAVLSQLSLCVGIWFLYRKSLQSPAEPFYLLWVDGLLVAGPLLTFLFF